MITLAEARFERLLAESLRDFERGLREEMATTRVEMFKWSFLFWVGQVVTLGGLIVLLFRTFE